MDEILKFLPDGAGTVPDEAFWTVAGRRIRDEQAQLFERGRLLAAARRYRQEITEFTARQS